MGLLPGKGIRKAGSKKVISSRKAIYRVGGPALGSGLSAKAWGHFWGVLGRVSRHWGKQGIIWIILAGMISELARKWETRRYAIFMGVYRFLHI